MKEKGANTIKVSSAHNYTCTLRVIYIHNKGAKEEGKVTFDFDKHAQFSDWYTEIVKRAELADLRYNVKGFLVFQPWSVLCMETMYAYYEQALQRKGHKPYWYPAVIPEHNLNKESEHVEGFVPEVFWVTEHGEGEKLEDKLALRPTSETAFYQMFSLWIRSHNDLPFKTYQRAQVWRYETKATRPFLRSREFHWIETHNAFATAEDAEQQVREDMETTKEMLTEVFGIPFLFFRRPKWDTFAGAEKTFAGDTRMPDGRILQLPSTHFLGQGFAKAFNVTFTNEKGDEPYVYLTCYGPAISRIFAAVVAVHGDNKGLRFPFEIAPVQVMIVPIAFEKERKVLRMAEQIQEQLREKGYRAEVDKRDLQPGNKFYHWEMKGVPLRLELGPRELKEGRLTLYRRDTGEKQVIDVADIETRVEEMGKAVSRTLAEEARKQLEGTIHTAGSLKEVQQIIEKGQMARVDFCSTGKKGEACAEKVEKAVRATVRGTRVDETESAKGDCVVCHQPGKEVVYIGKQY